MSRIRTVKPGFFTHGELFDAEAESDLPCRIAYAGLWTVADRKGRFKWKPRELKLAILPYDNVDMTKVLEALERHRFIFKYKCAGEDYGFIPKFEQHQFINKNEAQSTLPAPPENSNAPTGDGAEPEPEPSENSNSPAAHPQYSVVSVVSDTEILDTGREGVVVAPQADAPQPQAKSIRGTRWPKGKPVPDPWLEDAATRRRENQLEAVDLRLEAEKFANHWVAKAGGRGVGLDWHATWMNWALRAEKPRTNGFHRKESEHEKLERITREFIKESAGNTGGNRGSHQPPEPELLASSDEREPIEGMARNLLPRLIGPH